MENKILGIILMLVCVSLGILIFAFDSAMNKQADSQCSCTQNSGTCAHASSSRLLTYFGILIMGVIGALGIYMIFFEKSQKAIVSALENQKQIKLTEEKLDILLKALSQDEQKVIKAVKEQDGITQQTLRLRTDLHKSKLSIVLDSLEKKGLVKRIEKGKTKEVFLKIKL